VLEDGEYVDTTHMEVVDGDIIFLARQDKKIMMVL